VKSWTKLCAVALAVFAVGVSAQTSQPHPPKPPFPQIDLPQKARGAQAIQLLGGRLPEVAAWYGKSPAEFASILRRDRMAIIDRKGRMLYEEEIEPPTGTVGSPTSTGALVPHDQTFKLHSKPGSKRTIYLNFVGATLTNTVWNSSASSITALPFDLDGVPYSMSGGELERIQYIWQRVAEDYAPFDVNVTTEPPAADALTRSGSGDDTFGTTVLITQRTFYSCSCGGVAYIGVFDDTSNYNKPALVFYDRLGGGNEKYVAEAISHEAGHNMGLHHDGSSTTGYYQGHGSGATGWAPIMGVGYYQSLVQWSKGEYPDANNKEDDYAVVASNGLPLRADDHGNTTGTATRLAGTTVNGVTTVNGAGIIEKAGDVDVFSLSAAAGTITINVNPSARSGNADLYVELLNGNGSIVTSSGPAEALNGSLTANVTVGGTYYVTVRGAGKGDLATGYSSYGSVGEYSVSGTVPASASQPPTASFTVSTTSGYAPLAVNFNGSGSSDPDGSIVSHQWTFGDGTPATGATVSKTYSAAGTYTATLNVTDNSGLTSSKSVVITVQSVASQPPVASASASPYTGVAPLPVTFYSNGSYDPEGGSLSYAWNFGDNSTGAGATVPHTYSVPGTYIATLTVTDNAGLTSSKSVTITATSGNSVTGSTQMYASTSVSVSANKGGQAQAIAYVTVTDASGKKIPGASVTGKWSGAVSGSGSGTTGSTGLVAISSSRTKLTGTFTFTVSNVSLGGYTFAGTSSGSATR
jgi:PKD repeat protein